MTDATVRNIQMTFVNQASSSENYSKRGRATLRNGTNNDCEIYAKFALPGGLAKYSNMKFRIYSSMVIPGRTYVLQRVTSDWDFARIKWSKRPTSTSTGQVTVTASVAAKGYLEFDVTTLLNNATTAGKFYGFRIFMSSTDNTAYTFFTQKGSQKYGPVLTGSYTTGPRPPANLNPADGRYISTAKPIMTSEFFDRAGSTQLAAMRVQIHSSSDFTTPDFDSNWYNTDSPEIDLANYSYSIANTNVNYYWRANHRDADGNESGWSTTAVFMRGADKPVPVFNSPGASPNNFVEDATPTVLWTVSNQRSFQLILWNADKTVALANSGKLTDTDTDYQLSLSTFAKGRSLMENTDYVLELRVWDSLLRTSLPNDPAYASVETTFRYVPSTSVTAVTDLVATQVGSSPWAQLDFKRSSAPDYFDVFRDGVMIKSRISPQDLFVSGTSYRFVDRTAAPRQNHTWEVKASQNGKQSAGNAKITKSIAATTAFLYVDGTDILIPFVNYEPDLKRSDGSYVVNVLNSDEPITVYQGQATRQGTFVGLISGAVPHPTAGAKTSRQYRSELFSLDDEANRGRLCFLSWRDEMVPVVVSRIDDSATIYKEEICYLASFYVTERTGVSQT